jgi:hypothetical protein
MEASERLEYPFWLKLRSRSGSVEQERSRHAASKCPRAEFLGQNVVDGLVIQTQFTSDHSGTKCRSDLTRALTLVTFSSVFDVQVLPERGSSSTRSRPSKILYAT